MEEAGRRLGRTIQSKLKQLSEEEARNGSKLPRTLDSQAFILLADTVSFFAILKIPSVWEATKDEMNTGVLRPKAACSQCELVIRFGLPCKHYLALPFQDGAPIPRSLLHPRWWINSEPVRLTHWKPLYHTFSLPILPPRNAPQLPQSLYISPLRNQITRIGLQVLEARESLTGYARARYDIAATNAQQGLVEYAQELREDDLHTQMPDIVKRPGWNRQFKSHNKTQKRLMTRAEAAERDANYRERAVAQEARLHGTNAFLLQGSEPMLLYTSCFY
jgi:hypothetical protein